MERRAMTDLPFVAAVYVRGTPTEREFPTYREALSWVVERMTAVDIIGNALISVEAVIERRE
jgi:hypothetical protein